MRPVKKASSVFVTATILAFFAFSTQAREAIDDPVPPTVMDPSSSGERLKVLTYNIFMRPPVDTPVGCLRLCDDQDQRAPLIGTHPDLQDYDVIVFQEAFSDSHRNDVLQRLASAYPHKTHILGRGGRKASHLNLDTNGGVVILSKWPIEREFQRLYSDLCVGTDCWADKGVLYARLNWNGKPLHIFGTHTQADDDQRPTREAQLINIKWLIKAMAIPADQPVLIAGDMNVDLYNADEYNAMLGILEATQPLPSSGDPNDYGYTSDPANEYVDDKNRAKYLDYFLYSSNHLKPNQASNDVRVFQVGGRDLSDHYAVEGNFTFSGIGAGPTGTFPFVTFFEGNDAWSDEFHCNVSMEREKELVFGYPEECDGDKVRSLILYDVPAGRVLRLYDDSDGNRDDDWVEIITKRKISEKTIGTFEQSFEDDDVLVTYSRNDGLDGKVSRLEVDFCVSECGAVFIVSPNDGATVQAGSTFIAKVWARLGTTNVQLYVDGVPQVLENFDGNSRWTFRWDVPSAPGRVFQLQASAWIDGNQEQSNTVTVTAAQITEVTFEAPDPSVPVPIGQPTTVIVAAPRETASVDLQVSPRDGDPGGPMTKNVSPGKWQYRWTPQPPGGIEYQSYTLRAVAYDVNNALIDDGQIQVTAQGTNPADPRIEAPAVVFAGSEVTVTVIAPGANNVSLTVGGVPVNLVQTGSKWVFKWFPLVGTYHLEALAAYGGGVTERATWDIEVREALDIEITQINEYAIVAKVPEFQPNAWLYFGGSVPTNIPTSDYACGVVGFLSKGGDIGEVINYGSDVGILDIVGVYPIPGESNWQVFADFNTLNNGWWIWPIDRSLSYEDRPETWEIYLLCISKEVASFYSFRGLGDNIFKDTGIRYDEKACSIAGFRANQGDINENGTHDIIQTYLKRQNNTWRIRADFATHKGDKGGHEDWDIYLLCLDRDVASLDGPVPGKPFFLKEYFNLGDNLGREREFNTRFSVDNYVCGVAGFAALDGDIDEHDKGKNTNLFSAYLYPKNGSWHIRADFRTHKNDETWNVNILCAGIDGYSPPAPTKPTISAPVYITGNWQEPISFSVKATDPNGDEVKIIANGLPSGATLSPTTGTGSVTAAFNWNPAFSDFGREYQMTFTAVNVNGEKSSATVTVISLCGEEIECLL